MLATAALPPTGRASALTKPSPPSEAQRQLIEDPALCRLNPQIALKRTNNGVRRARQPSPPSRFSIPSTLEPGTPSSNFATATRDAGSFASSQFLSDGAKAVRPPRESVSSKSFCHCRHHRSRPRVSVLLRKSVRARRKIQSSQGRSFLASIAKRRCNRLLSAI